MEQKIVKPKTKIDDCFLKLIKTIKKNVIATPSITGTSKEDL